MMTRSIVIVGLMMALMASRGVLAQAPEPATQPAQPPAEVSWPREFEKDGKKLTVYQPQVDSWTDYKTLHFRSAISIEGVLKEEKFGVVEGDATTIVDHAMRMVAIIPVKREFRFPKVTPAEAALLEATINQLNPPGNPVLLSLDRVLAYVDASKQPVQKKVEVSLDPPKIFYSADPAILLSFMGKPRLDPIDKNNPNLQFVVNTNWDVLYDMNAKAFYVLNGDHWITTQDLVKGPFTPTVLLPPSFSSLPNDENWAEVRKAMPAKPAASAPRVFVTTEPAEMIVTEGRPQFRQIPQTALAEITNTQSVLFYHTQQSKFYFLVAGRWFSAASLDGPWAAASKDLPKDFAAIPDNDPAEFVKASVPGTQEAQDAVLMASVPNFTEVSLTEKPVQVTYSGEPKFVQIQGTTVKYATNTPYSVFVVDGVYYCCEQGVWFTAKAANGPWTFCTVVPPAIYTIPSSHPSYNVTYVTVQSSTPTTVVYSQTSGYSGEYVAATGVLMFGMGMLVGAAIADNDHHYYYPPRPALYSYGCGAVYHYGYGGYYAAGHRYYGPYGGAGYSSAYNPATGTYSRSAYAYGPYGSARTSAAYNPYTGARAYGGQVNTAYGSAGRAAGYNPSTGTYARAGYSSGQYGSAGFAQAYNPRTGQGVSAGAVSTAQGSAAGIRTTQGTGAAAWDTKYGQGAAAKTKSGNVYASNGDSVYKKDSSGNWSKNSGSGWESVSKPESSGSRSWESQAQSRERSERQTQRTSQYQSRSSSGGGRRR